MCVCLFVLLNCALISECANFCYLYFIFLFGNPYGLRQWSFPDVWILLLTLASTESNNVCISLHKAFACLFISPTGFQGLVLLPKMKIIMYIYFP